MKKIKLTQDEVAIVDDSDFDFLNQWQWHVAVDGDKKYAIRAFWAAGKQNIVAMHRQIIGVTDSKILIDHKDHNGLNNQKNNLRPCRPTDNSSNRIPTPNKTSNYLGVCWDKSRNQWMATIGKNKKRVTIGRFDDEIEAAKAYNERAKIVHGEFANLNDFEYGGIKRHWQL